MNKTILALAVVSLLCIASCKKETTTTCTPTDTTQTFTAKVKPIIDNNCVGAGCHDASSPPRVNLTTYDGVVSATKNNNLINQLQTGVMPKNGTPLPDSLIQKVIAWRDNCYQQ